MVYECTPMNLNRWLAVATDELCDEARQRVRAEITAHYEDALAAARESGKDEPAAQREAVLSLGSPERANSHLKKVYLRNTDYKHVEKYKNLFLQTPRGHKRRVILGVTILILGCSLVKYYWPADSLVNWDESPKLLLLLVFFFYYLASALEIVRAHFLFSTQSRITERWFMFQAGILLTLLNIPWLFLLYADVGHNSLPPRYAWYATGQKYLVLFLWMIAGLLVIAHERETYITLRRKIRDIERMENENHPEGYA